MAKTFDDLNLAAVPIECCPVPQPATKTSGFLTSLIFSQWSFSCNSSTTFEIGAVLNLNHVHPSWIGAFLRTVPLLLMILYY